MQADDSAALTTARPKAHVFAESTPAREAQAPLVLALDAGTSGVRAAAFDALGREVEGTGARLVRGPRASAGGGAEADPDELLADVVLALDEAHGRASALPLKIEALALTCFWHGLVGVDAAGRALTPLYGWADTRAAAQAEELRRRFDERAAHARTGCRFHPSYWPAKLLWLRAARPHLFEDVARWFSFGEFLTLRLCGAGAAGVSQASATGLFAQRERLWDDELLAGLNLHPDKLPALAGDEPFTLAPEYASRWPRLKGCTVFAPVGDGAASNVGSGCVTTGEAALMIGTSGALRVLYEGEPPPELPEALWCYRADARRAVVGGALSDGGGLYGWLKESLRLPACDAEIERELAAIGPDAHGLTVLPFWAGERSTGWQPAARGAILGLTTGTRPLEITRAAMEAVAYRFALIAAALDRLAPGAQIRATGGALNRSPVWAQIVADALGRTVELSPVREASSRGAALLALERIGAIRDLTSTRPVAGTTYEPDNARHALYRAGLARQQAVYETLLGDGLSPGRKS